MAGYELVEAVTMSSKGGNSLPLVLGVQLVYFVLYLTVFVLAGAIWMSVW